MGGHFWYSSALWSPIPPHSILCPKGNCLYTELGPRDPRVAEEGFLHRVFSLARITLKLVNYKSLNLFTGGPIHPDILLFLKQ